MSDFHIIVPIRFIMLVTRYPFIVLCYVLIVVQNKISVIDFLYLPYDPRSGGDV